jgi:hypothetical protein
VRRDGEALASKGKAQRRPLDMLKALVAHGGRHVDTSVLTAQLWPDAEGDDAKTSFDSGLYRLRKLLGVDGALIVAEGKLSFNPDVVWVDVWAFEHALDATPPDVDAALALYRGHFLGLETPAPWAMPLRDRLQARLSRAVPGPRPGARGAAGLRGRAPALRTGIGSRQPGRAVYRRLMVCQRELGDPPARCRRTGGAASSCRSCSAATPPRRRGGSRLAREPPETGSYGIRQPSVSPGAEDERLSTARKRHAEPEPFPDALRRPRRASDCARRRGSPIAVRGFPFAVVASARERGARGASRAARRPRATSSKRAGHSARHRASRARQRRLASSMRKSRPTASRTSRATATWSPAPAPPIRGRTSATISRAAAGARLAALVRVHGVDAENRRGPALDALAESLIVHEVAHLHSAQAGLAFPTRWLEEAFANYVLVAVLGETDPEACAASARWPKRIAAERRPARTIDIRARFRRNGRRAFGAGRARITSGVYAAYAVEGTAPACATRQGFSPRSRPRDADYELGRMLATRVHPAIAALADGSATHRAESRMIDKLRERSYRDERTTDSHRRGVPGHWRDDGHRYGHHAPVRAGALCTRTSTLLGWASLAIMGVVYHVYPPRVQRASLAFHFWIHNIALPCLMARSRLALTGS